MAVCSQFNDGQIIAFFTFCGDTWMKCLFGLCSSKQFNLKNLKKWLKTIQHFARIFKENRARIDFGFSPILSIFLWPRFILSATALKDSSRHQNPLLEPVVWITNVSLNSVIYHLEPHLITRPASVKALFPLLPRCQFTSTLWMLVCWKSSPGQVRSQGLPWCRCQALQSARCLI